MGSSVWGNQAILSQLFGVQLKVRDGARQIPYVWRLVREVGRGRIHVILLRVITARLFQKLPVRSSTAFSIEP